jgi:hypothetical protein
MEKWKPFDQKTLFILYLMATEYRLTVTDNNATKIVFVSNQ